MVRLSAISALLLFCLSAFGQGNNGGFLQHRRTASRPPPAVGGGASAFSFVQYTNKTDNQPNTITNLQMSVNITAGNLLAVWCGYEDADSGTSEVTNCVERGGGTFVALSLREQEGGFLSGKWFYLLSATGGGVNIDLQWNAVAGALPHAMRIIALEFDYGGTASFVIEGNNGADTGTSMTSASVSNSGTHRLNICGYIGFDSSAVTSILLGGAAATTKPAAQYNTAWTWYNAEQLSSENSSATRGTSDGWLMHLICFAAN